jgi:carotenoid cleavage dioxygenase
MAHPLMSWHDVEPCDIFHFMNADDDGAGVVLDVMRHDSIFRTKLLEPEEDAPTLDRWQLDGRGAPVKEERLDQWRAGRRHRDRLCRVLRGEPDPQHGGGADPPRPRGGHVCRARLRSPRHGGRAVFGPRRDAAAEEDRWLLALVYSGESDASSLQILDASDLPGEPAAIVELPERVPVGFHGNWVPDLV